MILHDNTKNVETNMTGAGSFSIKASAKAFKILSDGLYSDKIRAVVRELSCNALDSHTAAGCPEKPIFVHLPNAFEQWFSVRDEGLGLSKESVMNLYTTYFESTKTESNDQIGALGLGSKSPFSYTDSFTVTSVFDGVESQYAAYIGSNGEPAIQHLVDNPTAAHNGVEVKFPVKKDDMGAFIERASLVYRPFKVKPIISGKTEFKIAEHEGEVLYSGNGWEIRRGGYWNNHPYALQGNIEYKLDADNIEHKDDSHNFILKQNASIDFDLGLLDISASRESLGYDKITQDNIKARLDEVYKELIQQINDKIANAESLYNAKIQLQNAIRDLYDGSRINVGFEWNGVDVDTANFSVAETDGIVKYYPTNTAARVKRTPIESRFSPSKEFTFFLNDEKNKNKGITKIRAWVHENQSTAIMIMNTSILDKIGNPDFMKASDLEDPTVSYSSGSKADRRKTGSHFKQYRHYESHYWQFDGTFGSIDEIVRSDVDTVYYVPVKAKESRVKNIHTLVEVGHYIGAINKDNVIGIKESYMETKTWKDNRDSLGVTFINLKDHVEAEFEKIKGSYILNTLADTIAMSRYYDTASYKIRRLADIGRAIELEIRGTEFDTIVKSFTNGTKEVESLKMSNSVMDYVLKHIGGKNDLSVEERLFTKYPMLDIIDTWGSDKSRKAVAHYVNLVESC